MPRWPMPITPKRTFSSGFAAYRAIGAPDGPNSPLVAQPSAIAAAPAKIDPFRNSLRFIFFPLVYS